MFVGNERRITMTKTNLLQKLRDGLIVHQQMYEAADTAWKEAVLEFAGDLAIRVAQDDFTDLKFVLPRPVNNSRDIERAIAMVENGISEEVIIDERTFTQWVLGEWAFSDALMEIMGSASALVGKYRSK